MRKGTAPRQLRGAVGYFTAHGDLDTRSCYPLRAGENGIATAQAAELYLPDLGSAV